MKLPILILCLMTVFTPALADDAIKIVERKSCEQIKTEIAELSAVQNKTPEQQAEFKQLAALQRSSCGVKSGGRRAVARTNPSANNVPGAVKSDALTEYMDSKRANCEKLNSAIADLTADSTDSAKASVLAEMQRVYDMDCTEHKAPENAPEQPLPMTPDKTDEEWAAEFDANLAAGLCGDGTKPNRYGCCTDEIFHDMGNAVFACCPKSGGDCFPPIQK